MVSPRIGKMQIDPPTACELKRWAQEARDMELASQERNEKGNGSGGHSRSIHRRVLRLLFLLGGEAAITARYRRHHGSPKGPKRARSDFEQNLDANDAAGMPEGAAWALAEEQAGLEFGDGVYHIGED